MPLKFSIRDLLLVTVIAAVGTSWWLDHRRLSAESTPSVAFGLTPNGTPTPTLDLEFKQLASSPSVTKVQTRFRTPLGADEGKADFYPHGLMEGMQREMYKGDAKTFAWQDAVDKQVTVEGIAWGSVEKGLGEYVIMNEAKVFVDRGNFLHRDVYGRPVSVTGTLRLKTGIAGSPLQVFIIENAEVQAIEKVQWPWMTQQRGKSRAATVQTVSPKREEQKSTIQVGGSIVAAEQTLRTHKNDFYEGGLALANVKADVGFITCTVDKHRTTAAVFYSKSTKKITSIAAIFFPQQRHTKLQEIWTDAKGFTLGDDGEYSIEFRPATPPIEPPEDEFPHSEPVKSPNWGRGTLVPQNFAPPSSERTSQTTGAEKRASPLEGEWTVFSANYGLSGFVYYTFTGNRLTVVSWTSQEKRVDAPKTKSVDHWTVEIDESQSPLRLIMTSARTTGKKPFVLQQAFQLKDGELWLREDDGKPITAESFDPRFGNDSRRLTGLRREE